MLKASQKTNSSSNSKTTNNNKVVENGVKETNGTAEKRPSDDKAAEPVNKKARILENLHYEDLEDSNKNEESQELKLSKV